MSDIMSNELVAKPHHVIEEIGANLAVYIEPELLIEEARKGMAVTGFNTNDLERYSGLLSNIRYAWEKTKKYVIYFSDFYPTEDKVNKVEALNHHIHAYLQDMDTLKNKIETFLNILNGDILKKATNKDEVKKFFDEAHKTIDGAFEGILKYRRQHIHQGTRFMDGDLLKAENAEGTAQMLQSPVAAPYINKDVVPIIIGKLMQQKEEGFEVAKIRWVGIAQKNNVQTTGLLEGVLRGVEPLLYEFLNITPMRDFKRKTSTPETTD